MERQVQASESSGDEPNQRCGSRPESGARRSGYTLAVLFPLLVGVMLAALAPSTAAAAPHERNSSACDGPTIVRRLAFVDEGQTHPTTIEIARAEVESIWATAGVRLVWVSGAPGATPRPDAFVVLREGRANMMKDAAMMRSGWFRQLGWVRFNADGARAHLVEVSLANVRLSLRHAWHDDGLRGRLAHQPKSVRIVVMGRVLGRIIAHEFGHWLLGRGHEAAGLMKAELNPRELMARETPRLPRAWTDRSNTSDPRMTRLRAFCGSGSHI